MDLCASGLDADGVVLDVRHFPRTDSDYLAQIKKMATDLGLTPAAIRDDSLFERDASGAERVFELTVAVGAPLLATRLPFETAASWTQTLERLGDATGCAKRLNVTLAVRNAAGTFAGGSHDLKRVSKEADSAWLRYGPDFAAFGTGAQPEALLSRTVLAWHEAACGDEAEIAQTAGLLGAFRGFLALDRADGGASPADMQSALHRWRRALVECQPHVASSARGS